MKSKEEQELLGEAGLNTYYVTVGQRYREEAHPQELHPDGYVEILAPTLAIARACAMKHFSNKWAFIYKDQEFDMRWFPRGRLQQFIVSAEDEL